MVDSFASKYEITSSDEFSLEEQKVIFACNLQKMTISKEEHVKKNREEEETKASIIDGIISDNDNEFIAKGKIVDYLGAVVNDFMFYCNTAGLEPDLPLCWFKIRNNFEILSGNARKLNTHYANPLLPLINGGEKEISLIIDVSNGIIRAQRTPVEGEKEDFIFLASLSIEFLYLTELSYSNYKRIAEIVFKKENENPNVNLPASDFLEMLNDPRSLAKKISKYCIEDINFLSQIIPYEEDFKEFLEYHSCFGCQ